MPADSTPSPDDLLREHQKRTRDIARCPGCGVLSDMAEVATTGKTTCAGCGKWQAASNWKRFRGGGLWITAVEGGGQKASWWEVVPALPSVPTPEIEPASPVNDKVKGKGIDAKMLALLRDDPTRLAWTARQWAEHLDCSDGTVKATKTWRDTIRSGRAMAKAGRLWRLPARGEDGEGDSDDED